jgi:hypothetical protein
MLENRRATKLALVALLAALTLTAAASAGSPDPRTCTSSKLPARCSKQAAVKALRLKMAKVLRTRTWDAHITCAQRSPKYLLWACTWKSNPTDTPGRARVRFWATSTGWHTRVTVIAQAIPLH